MASKKRNQAFIDGQNLYLGMTKATNPWKVDLNLFYQFLAEQFDVSEAYYFVVVRDPKQKQLYANLRKAGFRVVFRAHSDKSSSNKKGNVDTDIVFEVMRKFAEKENPGKFYLVSGDGDYYKMVKYLREKGKLGKIVCPNRENYSRLYDKIGREYRLYLSDPKIRRKIELHKNQK